MYDLTASSPLFNVCKHTPRKLYAIASFGFILIALSNSEIASVHFFKRVLEIHASGFRLFVQDTVSKIWNLIIFMDPIIQVLHILVCTKLYLIYKFQHFSIIHNQLLPLTGSALLHNAQMTGSLEFADPG